MRQCSSRSSFVSIRRLKIFAHSNVLVWLLSQINAHTVFCTFITIFINWYMFFVCRSQCSHFSIPCTMLYPSKIMVHIFNYILAAVLFWTYSVWFFKPKLVYGECGWSVLSLANLWNQLENVCHAGNECHRIIAYVFE